MLGILHHIRRFLLSARKRYSPVRLLQYLLALCRAVFSRCKSKCNDQDSSHEFLPKILTPAEGKGSLSEEGTVNPVGHVISGSRTPKQVEEGGAQIAEIFPSCVCDQLLPIVYANHHHLAPGMTYPNLLSDRMRALKVSFHSKNAYVACGPTIRVCLTWCSCSITLDSSSVPLLILKSSTKMTYGLLILRNGNLFNMLFLLDHPVFPRLYPQQRQT